MNTIYRLLFFFQILSINSQSIILPGDKDLNISYLKSDSYLMSYLVKNKGEFIEIGTYKVDILNDNKNLSIKTSLNLFNNNSKWMGETIANAIDFQPKTLTETTSEKKLTLDILNNNIKGNITNVKTKKSEKIDIKSKESFFDISQYPFIIKSLSLKAGYKAIIPVFCSDAIGENKFSNVIINEVKSDLFISDLTGEHKVWRVSIYEECRKHKFQFYIDKENRRIWRINITTDKGDIIELINKQIDFNPFKNKFDKEATYNLVNNGSSSIEGVAFVRDNENEGIFKGMAVLNVNKKQYAPKGTTVVLMPNTPYFEEWMELNKKQEKIKNAKMIPLPQEAFDCFKFTTVYDDEGNFEFTNLMQGEYLISTSFGYTHTSRRSEVTGVSDVYRGGNYVGSNVYTSVFAYKQNSTANIQKVIKINEDNKVFKFKLKQTR